MNGHSGLDLEAPRPDSPSAAAASWLPDAVALEGGVDLGVDEDDDARSGPVGDESGQPVPHEGLEPLLGGVVHHVHGTSGSGIGISHRRSAASFYRDRERGGDAARTGAQSAARAMGTRPRSMTRPRGVRVLDETAQQSLIAAIDVAISRCVDAFNISSEGGEHELAERARASVDELKAFREAARAHPTRRARWQFGRSHAATPARVESPSRLVTTWTRSLSSPERRPVSVGPVPTGCTRAGWVVVGASRRGTSSGSWEGVVMDVDRDESVREGIADVLARHHRIDAVVASAGWGVAGAVEHTTIDEAKAQVETNLWGATASSSRYCRPCAPRGVAASCSSAPSEASSPFPSRRTTASASSPSRDSGEALAYEVAPFGIDVTLVEPGNVRTDFTANRKMAASSSGDEVYRRALDTAVGAMERDEANGVAPDGGGGCHPKSPRLPPPAAAGFGRQGRASGSASRQTAASPSRLRGRGQEQPGREVTLCLPGAHPACSWARVRAVTDRAGRRCSRWRGWPRWRGAAIRSGPRSIAGCRRYPPVWRRGGGSPSGHRTPRSSERARPGHR